MNFTAFLRKRLVDLLEKRRIVVWYDPDKAFSDFIASFKAPSKAPSCVVLSAADSILRARRMADEAYRRINESDDPAEARKSLLIYVPYHRGTDEDTKMCDPFEVYSLAGAAFGDSEDQRLESLARQAMPERADEITRLFREGKPTIALLDGLGKAQRYPLLNQYLRTESPAEVIAMALCSRKKSKLIAETPGCVEELLRLTEAAISFRPPGLNLSALNQSALNPPILNPSALNQPAPNPPPTPAKDWAMIQERLGTFVLFSEFAFDLPGDPPGSEVPESLSAVARAEKGAQETIYAACDRMRADANLRDAYIELADRVERELHLAELLARQADLGERDTFPFEERRLFHHLVTQAGQSEFIKARTMLDSRRQSVWKDHADRYLLWVAAERGVALLETAERIESTWRDQTVNLPAMVNAYAVGGCADLDRNQRLFEQSIADMTFADDGELDPLVNLCRQRYRSLALAIQQKFLHLVQGEGWPPEGILRQTRIFDEYVAPGLEQREKVAYFMVDSLRFEMGRDLGEALRRLGEVEIMHAASILPTITDFGMAALMPNADGRLRLVEKDNGFVPALGTRLLEKSDDRMKLLRESYGDRFIHLTLDELLSDFKKHSSQIGAADLLVIRTQDPDAIGEALGSRLARKYITDVIGDLTRAIERIISLGFKRIVISADHGHVLLPEIPAGDIVSEPPGRWPGIKRRYRLGSGLSDSPGTLTLKAGHVGMQGDIVDICISTGFKVFSGGEAYFHGGLSLQEAIIPVVLVHARKAAKGDAGLQKISIHYRSDKFTSRVIGIKLAYTHPGLFSMPVRVSVKAYDGSSLKAKLVGEAADCEARDEKTKDVTLHPGKETPVPILIDSEFQGKEVEIRVSDPQTGISLAKCRLKNAMME